MVDTLMSELNDLGIRLWIKDGQLQYEAPPGTFTEDLKNRLLEQKPNLLLEQFSADLALHQLFELQTELSPDLVAVQLGDQNLTYQELNKRANQTSRYLESSGIAEGQKVGICWDRSIDALVALLAVLKLGCSFMPLSVNDSSERIVSICRHHRIFHILHGSSDKMLPDDEQIALINVEGIEGDLNTFKEDNLGLCFPNSQAAFIHYPNNQTVNLDHATLIRSRLLWQKEVFGRSPETHVLTTAEVSDSRFLREVFGAWSSGAGVILADPEELNDADVEWNLTGDSQVELCLSQQELLSITTNKPNASKAPWNALDRVIVTGGPLNDQLVNGFYDLTSDHPCQLIYIYESAVLACELFYYKYEGKSGNSKPVLGHPIPGQIIQVQDSKSNQQPIGILGDVVVLVDETVYPEFKIQKAASAEKEGGLADQNFWYAVGERAQRLDNGLIQYEETIPPFGWLGDIKIDFRLIEEALLEHTAVEDCATRIRNSKVDGGQLVVYYTAAKSIAPSQLAATLALILPFEVQPKLFVPVTAIPRKQDGLVDEQALMKIIIIDKTAKVKLYEKIKSQSGDDELLVTLEEHLEESSSIHLADILPPLNNEKTSVDKEKAILETPLSDVPALVEGESFIHMENAPVTLQDILRSAADQSPVKGLHYYDDDGEKQSCTYPDLKHEAEKILSGLRSNGAKPDQIVIFQVIRPKDFVENLWACILGGFIPVLIAGIESYDQRNPNVQKLSDALEMFPEAMVVHDQTNSDAIKAFSENQKISANSFKGIESLRKHEADHHWEKRQPEDEAIFFLTSGSTGKPKVVIQTHGGLVSSVRGQSEYLGFSNDDVCLNWMPLIHPAGAIIMHLRNVFTGCEQVQVPTPLILKNPLKLLDLISEHKVTDSWSTNASFGLVVDSVKKAESLSWDLSSMKTLLNGGESLVSATTREFIKLLAPCGLSKSCMVPGWGMAETNSGAILSKKFSFDSTSDEDEFVNLGGPISGFSMRIADKNNQLLMENQIGELQVKGHQVTKGYHNNDEANNDAFTEDGWFRTGDLGRINDGHLTLTGREKEIIIVGGVNYHGHEIEAVVEGLDQIERSYTAACAARTVGDNTDQLAIFFHSPIATENELLELMKKIRSEVLGRVGIFPKYLVPVQKEEIPKTEIGKIQRSKLKEQFESGEFTNHLKRFDLLQKNQNTLPNWFFQTHWSTKRLDSPLGIAKQGRVMIFSDAFGLGDQLAEMLVKNNLSCVIVHAGQAFRKIDESTYEINPERPADYQELIDAVKVGPTPLSQVIHLWNYEQEQETIDQADTFEKAYSKGVYSLLYLLQSFGRSRQEDQSLILNVVASGSTIFEEEGWLHPGKGSLTGMLQTINIELPWIKVKLIDLVPDRSGKNAFYLLQEAQSKNKDRVVAYRQYQRWVPKMKQLEFNPEMKTDSPLKTKGNYLVTGGLGGIAQLVNAYLLKHYQANLLIVGRSELTEDKEKNASLESLAKLPGNVNYRKVDIRNAVALKDAIQTWESTEGTIDGIFHLASLSTEQSLLKENKQHLSDAMQVKLLAAFNLLQLFNHRNDLLWVNFSSVNGTFGGSNVAAYSAASSSLDAFSAYLQRQQPFQTYNLAWSMWEDIGMSQDYAMKEFTKIAGFQMINRETGIHSLVASLSRQERNLTIGLDATRRNLLPIIAHEPDSIYRAIAYRQTNKSEDAVIETISTLNGFGQTVSCQIKPVEELPKSVSPEYDFRSSLEGEQTIETAVETVSDTHMEIAQRVIDIVKDVIDAPSTGIDDNFFELGGSSMLAVQLLSRLEEEFNVELSLDSFFQSSEMANIRSIAARIGEMQGEGVVTSGAPGNKAESTTNFMEARYSAGELIKEADEIAANLPFDRAADTISEKLDYILLTGATGFIGGYLLAELIEKTEAVIYCLVRAENNELAEQRVIENLKSYKIWQESFKDRFKVVLGDLSKPRMGLSEMEYEFLAERVKSIYHNGAMVNLVLPYYVCKPANVGSTEELIRMACQGPLKSIHFISTMGVLSMAKHNEVFIDDSSDPDLSTFSGYIASKFACERLLFQAHQNGIPVTIHRIEQSAGDSRTGVVNLKDFFFQQFKALYEIGLFPEMYWNLTPVDFISKAIVHITLDHQLAGNVYHISNHKPTLFTEFLEELEKTGYQGRIASHDDLLEKANDFKPDHPLYPFLGMMRNKEAFEMMADLDQNPALQPDCSNTNRALEGSGINCPAIDSDIISTYFRFFNESGFIKLPNFN